MLTRGFSGNSASTGTIEAILAWDRLVVWTQYAPRSRNRNMGPTSDKSYRTKSAVGAETLATR